MLLNIIDGKVTISNIKYYYHFRLEDLYERLLMETRAEKITPLVTNPGRIMLTSTRLYFQPFNNVDPVSQSFTG